MPRTRSEIEEDQIFDDTGYFIQVPESVMDKAPVIGPAAFLLYAYLKMRANRKQNGKAFPSYDLIGIETGLSRQTISSGLDKLIESSLISRIREGRHNVYYIKTPVKLRAAASGDQSKNHTGDQSKNHTNQEEPVKKLDANQTESLNQTDLFNQTESSSAAEKKSPVPVLPALEDEGKRQPQKKGDILDGMLFYAQRPASPLASVAHFPPKVQDVLAEFIRLWKVTPPDPKARGEKSRFEAWIVEGEGLLNACGEIGLEALRRVHEEKQLASYPTRPGTLITWARTAAAKIRAEQAKEIEELALQTKKAVEREALDKAWAQQYPAAAASYKASLERSYE